MQSKHAFVPVIVFRCLIWMMTAACMAAGFSPLNDIAVSTIVILGLYTATYTVVWCLFLPRVVKWATQFPLLLLLDIALSAIPAWVSGGWLSPFLPFMLGALMLPGAIFYWRGAFGAIVAYICIDQLVGWTTWSIQIVRAEAVPIFTLGYLRPLIAALIWPASFELWKWRTRGSANRHPSQDILDHIFPSWHPQRSSTEPTRIASRISDEQALPSAPWRIAQRSAQTLERVPVALHAAIQQAVAEAEERGLQVRMTPPPREPALPQSHIQLLVKAVEIGLDNIECHAATREAEVVLAVEEHTASPQVVMTIRDHGSGLLDGTADPPGFHQIKRLRYRLAEIDGDLDVRESEEGGVIFVVRIPAR